MGGARVCSPLYLSTPLGSVRAAEEAQAADGEGADLPPVTLGLEGLAEALWDEDPEADGAGLMGDERFEDLFSEEEGDEA